MGAEATLRQIDRYALKVAEASADKTASPEQGEIDKQLREFVEARSEAYIPSILQEYEAVYASEFTSSELQGILAFQESGAGRHIQALAPSRVAELDLSKVKIPPSEDDVTAIVEQLRKGSPDLTMKLTNADLAQLVEFRLTEPGRALGRKTPEMLKAFTEFSRVMTGKIEHDRKERWCDLIHCTPLMRSWIDHPELVKAPSGEAR